MIWHLIFYMMSCRKRRYNALVVDNNLYDCVELSRQVAESDVFGVEQQLVKVKPLISFFGFNILDRVKTGEYKRVRFLYLPILYQGNSEVLSVCSILGDRMLLGLIFLGDGAAIWSGLF